MNVCKCSLMLSRAYKKKSTVKVKCHCIVHNIKMGKTANDTRGHTTIIISHLSLNSKSIFQKKAESPSCSSIIYNCCLKVSTCL